MIYIDNSSTTRQADEVTDLMADIARNDFGNPSSLHEVGFRAEKRVTLARKQFAKAVGCRPEAVTFNSGGTEGDNTVLKGAARARRHERKKIVTTAVEHPAVLEACKDLEQQGFEIVRVGVDEKCNVRMDELREAVDENTALVSVMTVNNEAGTIMPIRDIAAIAHAKGAWMHTDAVQALAKVRLKNLGADFISVSAHKIHGPKGVGALYANPKTKIPAFVAGGGQERGFRSGTENVPGIAGFGEACRLAELGFEADTARMAETRAYLLAGILDQIPDVLLNSPEEAGSEPGQSVCSVLNISFLGTRGEVLLHTLEQDEIYVSTGSACSSNHRGGSHVLAAMGRSHAEIESAVRFSLSRYNTKEEMDIVIDKLKEAVGRFRRLGKFQ